MAFGWGTNLTNDFEDCAPIETHGLDAISLVCKVTAANGRPAVKLSDNPAKATGDPDEIARYLRVFGDRRARRASRQGVRLVRGADGSLAGALRGNTPLCPAGHLPLKGGDWQLRRTASSCNAADWRSRPRRLISPLEGEMAGRPEGGRWRLPPTRTVRPPRRPARRSSPPPPSPTPPTAATCSSCRPATISSAARWRSPPASLVLGLLRGDALERACRRPPAASARSAMAAGLPTSLALLRLPRHARRRRLLRQPRSAVQPAAADRLDAALGRADARAGPVRQSLALDRSMVRAVAAGHAPARPRRRRRAAARLPAWLGMWPALLLLPRLRLVRADLPGARRSGPARPRRRPLLAARRFAAMLAFGHARHGAGAASSCRCSSPWWRASASSSARRPDGRQPARPLPARREARQHRAAAARPARCSCCRARLGLLRRLLEDLLLARRERHQSAGISRPHRADGHQQRRPARRLRRCSPPPISLRSPPAKRWPAAGSRLAAAAGLLVWSIVPIALAYHFSHYLTALLVNGQYALVALSDPFARGWNLFGTAYMAGRAPASPWARPRPGRSGTCRPAAIIGGHVLAVLAAHRLAFRLHPTPRAALAQPAAADRC